MTESGTPATAPPPRPARPRVPERAEFRFWTEEKLRNPDTDQFRHVNHAAMVSLFEAGRMELFARAEVRPLMQGTNLAVVRLLLHFHRELFYPGMVSVGSMIASVGNTSFSCMQGLFDETGCVASAEAVCVLFDPAHGRAHKIQESLRTVLQTP